MKILKICLLAFMILGFQGCSIKNDPSADVKTKSWDELMDGKEYRSATPENFDLNEVKN